MGTVSIFLELSKLRKLNLFELAQANSGSEIMTIPDDTSLTATQGFATPKVL